MFETLFAKLAGKYIGGRMDWINKNKGTISHIISLLLGIYSLLPLTIAPDFHFSVPAVPAWLLTFLGALGVYHNVTDSQS